MAEPGFIPWRSGFTAHLPTAPFHSLPLAALFGGRGTDNKAEGRNLGDYLEEVLVGVLRMTPDVGIG